MLKVLMVYRYNSSGKLIAMQNGIAFPLNSDLTFSGKNSHRVRFTTKIDETPYRIEVEIGRQGNQDSYKIIRKWNLHHLPPKSTDPNAPLEQRIDVSPSQEFNDAERKFIGQSSGNPIGFAVITMGIILFGFVGIWGLWPSILFFIFGISIVWVTTTPGDAAKMNEVCAAKERLRLETDRKFNAAIHNIRFWAELDGVKFEQAVAQLFKKQGFEIQFTPRTNDQGVDLIIRKNDIISIVQCKAYSGNVGVSAVRELIGVRASWPIGTDAILVTLYDFSNSAKKLAAKHDISLVSVAKDYLKTDCRPIK